MLSKFFPLFFFVTNSSLYDFFLFVIWCCLRYIWDENIRIFFFFFFLLFNFFVLLKIIIYIYIFNMSGVLHLYWQLLFSVFGHVRFFVYGFVEGMEDELFLCFSMNIWIGVCMSLRKRGDRFIFLNCGTKSLKDNIGNIIVSK